MLNTHIIARVSGGFDMRYFIGFSVIETNSVFKGYKMTETNKAAWTSKAEIYNLMKAGEVYNGHSIVELSGGKFTRQQASSQLRRLWTMNLLEITDTPTRPQSYLKLPGMKCELIGNRYKVTRETEKA
jgi:hypothetical protein